jgi:hypothetical protein
LSAQIAGIAQVEPDGTDRRRLTTGMNSQQIQNRPLPTNEERAKVVACLVEGTSQRATASITGDQK